MQLAKRSNSSVAPANSFSAKKDGSICPKSFFRHEPTAFERIVRSTGGLLAPEPGKARSGNRSIRSPRAVWKNTPRRLVRVVYSSAIPSSSFARSFLHRNCILDLATIFTYFFVFQKNGPISRRTVLQNPLARLDPESYIHCFA